MTGRRRQIAPRSPSEEAIKRLTARLIRAAFHGRNNGVLTALREGAPIDGRHGTTGLSALHIAVGSNNLKLAKLLIEEFHAPFGPDAFGRWPTTVAAECRADPDLLDYIVDAEAAFLEKEQASS